MLNDFLNSVKSFALAQALMTAVEFDLFRLLEGGPSSRNELRKKMGVRDSPILDAFFNILIAFGFLAEGNGKLQMTAKAAAILPHYDSIKSWIKEMQLFYDSLSNLNVLVKSGSFKDTALSSFWAYKQTSDRHGLGASVTSEYSSIMDMSQIQLSEIVSSQYDFGTHNHIVEFGGGYGRLATTLAAKYPNLSITVADLPAVCEVTRKRIGESLLGERINLLPVDFLKDDLPVGIADAVLFVRVLHDWEDMEVASILKRARSCLRSQGKIIIVEPITDEMSELNQSSVLSALMLALFGGRRRNVKDYYTLLRESGFSDPEQRDCGMSLYKMLIARSSPGGNS